MKKLSENQFNELCEKMESFEDYINDTMESFYEYNIESWESGEYSYLLESSAQCNIEHGTNIEESLLNKIKLSDYSLEEFIDESISNNWIKCEYEKMGSPFHYGGPDENEVYSVPIGEWEHQIDRDDRLDPFKLSFDLNQYFENKKSFDEFIRNEFKYCDWIEEYWHFFAENSTHLFFIDNYDYDCVRFIIDVENYEDEINELLEIESKSIKDYFETIYSDEFKKFQEKKSNLIDSLIEYLDEIKIESIDEIKDQIEYSSLDYSGRLHEIIDSNIEIYNYQLREWAVDNWTYCENAIEEGLYSVESSNFDFHALIQAGQYCYYAEEMNELIEQLNEILS